MQKKLNEIKELFASLKARNEAEIAPFEVQYNEAKAEFEAADTAIMQAVENADAVGIKTASLARADAENRMNLFMRKITDLKHKPLITDEEYRQKMVEMQSLCNDDLFALQVELSNAIDNFVSKVEKNADFQEEVGLYFNEQYKTLVTRNNPAVKKFMKYGTVSISPYLVDVVARNRLYINPEDRTS